VTKRYAAAAGFIRGKLYVTGGKDAGGHPIAGGEVYDPATDSWSHGPAYPTPTSWQTCGTTDGTLYCAGGVHQASGGLPQATAVGYALDLTKGRWTPIADPPVDVWGAAGTAASGRLLVAGGVLVGADAMTNEAYAYDPAADAWTAVPNLPQPLFSAASAPGWYVLGGQTPDHVFQAAAQVLAGFDKPHGDVPWLSEKAGAHTVAARRTVRLTVTADATGMGPADAGVHPARVVVDSDGPYGSVTVPVTMTVVPPHGGVLLSGTVSGSRTDGAAVPLAGATVRVAAGGGVHTLSTAVDGSYQVWLPDAKRTVALTVSAEGYRTAQRTLRPHGRGEATADFTLAQR
jgi:hypothetical protein